jgi:glycosyltransferase involved in cell wall biosynthesis
MHLAINVTDVGRQRGGNESYLLGLLDGLRSLPDSHDRFTLVACRAGATVLSTESWPDHFAIVDTGPWSRGPSYLWQQTQVLRRVQADWYFSTYLLPVVIPCRAVVLVHDLSFRAHPEYFPASIALYMTLLVGWAVRRAEVVIAVSEFTRSEIRRFYPSAIHKTTVVYNGVGREFTAEGDSATDQAVLHEYGVDTPYCLAVGNIHPRKNLGRLLEAYERLRPGTVGDRPEQAEWPAMVWVGVERWGSAQLQQRARAAGVRLTGRVAPEHLPALYRRAALLVYPSLYEGFGLPVLEAMACGTPVVASSTTSLPEVVGDAALMVDPTDVAALSAAMERALLDEALRTQLRMRGLARARQFNWAKTAGLILDSLRAVTPGAPRPASPPVRRGWRT